MTPEQIQGGLVGLVALAGIVGLYYFAKLMRWLNGDSTFKARFRTIRDEIEEENLRAIHASRYKRL